MFINEDGAFVETEPLEQVSAHQVSMLVEVLKQTFAVSPERADFSQSEDDSEFEGQESNTPIVLQKLGLKKWQDFEKKALMYTVHLVDGKMSVYITGRGADGMWSLDGSEQLEYSTENGIEKACEEIAGQISSRRPVKSTALGLLPRRD